MKRFVHSRGWRITSLVFGVLGPAVVWCVIAFIFANAEGPPGGRTLAEVAFWMGSLLFVSIEIVCMCAWLFGASRSAALERMYSIVFLVGSLFATAWAAFAALGFTIILLDERPYSLIHPIVLMMLSPFPCVFIYFVNARVAWMRAKDSKLAREGIVRAA